MKYISESKNLPFIIKTIKLHQLEGVLTCHFELGYPIELFFKGGELIHIDQQETSHTPYKLLDFILKWVTFNVEWRTVLPKIDLPNVSKNIRESFQEAIEGLTQEGTFLDAEQSELDLTFFDITPLKPKAEPLEKTPSSVKFTSPTNPINTPATDIAQKPKPRYTIETNLLLPPGPRQEQLEELLKNIDFKTQMEMLSNSHFTGAIYYHLGNYGTSRNEYGLVLLIEGRPSDIIYHPGPQAATQIGPTAFQALSGLNPTPEIYKVEIRTLKAYRGLVLPEETTRVYGANTTNFARILNAFRQSRRDGVVLLYFDSHKLHYFMMFENGLQVGIFGTDANSGRLQPLSAPIALPTNEREATMTVQLVTKKPELVISTNPPPNRADLTQPLTIPLNPQQTNSQLESDPVDWNGMLIDLNARVENPFERTDSQAGNRNFEDDNPYDF